MARTILYPTNCSKSVEVTSGITLTIPDGTSSVRMYAIVDPSKQVTPEYAVDLRLSFSSNGGATWVSLNSGGGTGTADAVSGHADGSAPGVIPSDSSEYTLVPNDSLALGTELVQGVPVAGMLCRGSVTVLGGNNGGPVNVGLSLVATNQFGDEVPF